MKRVLFQGDSITDAARHREESFWLSLGMGYATMAAGRAGVEFPGEYEFLNKGVSGNRVVDLYARWKIDCLNLKPDYLSILIGVNDVWHEIGEQNGVEAERFEKVYDMLLSETKAALPEIGIMLLEPYVLYGSGSKENWEYFRTEVEKRGAITKKLSEKYDLPFVPLQKKFDEALVKAPVEYWAGDGVHPTPAGAALIADAWLEAFKKNFR